MYSSKCANLYYLTPSNKYPTSQNTYLERSYVPLKEVVYDINVINYLVEQKITFTYRNESKDRIETTFTFPMHYDTCVYNFEAITGDKVIKCVLKEKEQAKIEYNNAVAAGKKTVLLQKDGGDCFTCKVGNMDPDQESIITITSCYQLANDSSYNMFRLTIPITITPRYVPASSSPYSSNQDNIISTLSFLNSDSTGMPYKISVKGVITMNCESIQVTDLTGVIGLSGISKNSLSFAVDSVESGKDLVLIISRSSGYSFLLSEDNTQSSVTSKYNYAHLLNMCPEQKSIILSPAANNDYSILLDRSGSMGGSRIEQAKLSLNKLLNILPAGCGINIYEFDDRFTKFNHTDRVLTSSYRDAAKIWINNINERGGTRFVPVLQQAITDLVSNAAPNKNLIFITDGDVGNYDAVMKTTELAKSVGVRLFILGIGDGCSKELLVKMARETKGSAEFVKNDEDMFTKLVSHVNKSRTDACKVQIKVDTEGSYNIVGDMNEEIYLYGDSNNLFYLYSEKPITKITACGNDILPEAVNNGLLKIVGKQIIDSIKDKERRIETSLSTGVLCEHTAFVGVEEIIEREETSEGIVCRRVAVPLVTLEGHNKAVYGPIGPTGAMGPTGPQGCIGPQGCTGPTGARGCYSTNSGSGSGGIGSGGLMSYVPYGQIDSIPVTLTNGIGHQMRGGINTTLGSKKNMSYDLRGGINNPANIPGPWNNPENIDPPINLNSIPDTLRTPTQSNSYVSNPKDTMMMNIRSNNPTSIDYDLLSFSSQSKISNLKANNDYAGGYQVSVQNTKPPNTIRQLTQNNCHIGSFKAGDVGGYQVSVQNIEPSGTLRQTTQNNCRIGDVGGYQIASDSFYSSKLDYRPKTEQRPLFNARSGQESTCDVVIPNPKSIDECRVCEPQKISYGTSVIPGVDNYQRSDTVSIIQSSEEALQNNIFKKCEFAEDKYPERDEVNNYKKVKEFRDKLCNNYIIKLTIESLDGDFEIIDGHYISKLPEVFNINVNDNDMIQVTQGDNVGIYKVICKGSSSDKWILRKIK
jgi:hypothetical protein